MPEGIPNHKSPPQVPDMAPEPFIMISQAGDQLKLNAYGMDAPQVIHSLRLALLHLVASHGGISEVFSGQTAIVMAKPAQPSPNGTGPKPKKLATTGRGRRMPREIQDPEDDDDLEQMIDREIAAGRLLPHADHSELARSIAAQAGSYYDSED